MGSQRPAGRAGRRVPRLHLIAVAYATVTVTVTVHGSRPSREHAASCEATFVLWMSRVSIAAMRSARSCAPTNLVEASKLVDLAAVPQAMASLRIHRVSSNSVSLEVRTFLTALTRSLSLGGCLAFAFACGGAGDGGDGEDATDASGQASQTSGGSGGTSDSSGGSGSTGTGTSESTLATEGSGSASEGDGPNLGPCAQYIECVMEVAPEAITSAIATYGEEGACWSLPGVAEEDCWTECTAHREALHETFPDAVACWECQADGDCPPSAAFCDDAEHTCADWDCRDDMDCPADAPYCDLSHACAAEEFVHCGNPQECLHGRPEDVTKLCKTGFGSTPEPGPCPTEGAIGFCVIRSQGWFFTYYSDDPPGQNQQYCEMGGGVWMPA
jgi:hypothetical protein